jgi:hypothetical protein
LEEALLDLRGVLGMFGMFGEPGFDRGGLVSGVLVDDAVD